MIRNNKEKKKQLISLKNAENKKKFLDEDADENEKNYIKKIWLNYINK